MKREPVNLVLNGKEHRVDSPSSIADLLGSMGFKPTQVVVEWNGKVLDRAKLGEVVLGEGDQLEIIVPVAGG